MPRAKSRVLSSLLKFITRTLLKQMAQNCQLARNDVRARFLQPCIRQAFRVKAAEQGKSGRTALPTTFRATTGAFLGATANGIMANMDGLTRSLKLAIDYLSLPLTRETSHCSSDRGSQLLQI